jgi:transcriptional regulator with XRE-family HTH domain
MSTDRLSLPDILRGLILSSGLSQQEAALRSGISPGSVAMICTRTPKPLLGWLRLVAALGCQLTITSQERGWPLAMPGASAAVIAHEWSSWRRRRMVTTINHLRAADARIKRTVLEERARAYAANEESRLRARLEELKASCATLHGSFRAAGLRAALRLVADRLALKAEELTLLSGASLSACQLALGENHDGRLATLHRLCSALGARLALQLAEGSVSIGFCPPGDWRPGMPEADAAECPDEKPPGAVRAARDNQNRSRLALADMLALYDDGVSIGEIARRAGVSRQRVHKLAMDSGRIRRRQLAREQRVAAGRDLLRLAEATVARS